MSSVRTVFCSKKIPFHQYFNIMSKLLSRKTTLTDINNLREKFSLGPGFEPGSPALCAGAITIKPPRRSTGPTSSCLQTEVKDHPASLGVICGQCTLNPIVIGFLGWDYR